MVVAVVGGGGVGTGFSLRGASASVMREAYRRKSRREKITAMRLGVPSAVRHPECSCGAGRGGRVDVTG